MLLATKSTSIRESHTDWLELSSETKLVDRSKPKLQRRDLYHTCSSLSNENPHSYSLPIELQFTTFATSCHALVFFSFCYGIE